MHNAHYTVKSKRISTVCIMQAMTDDQKPDAAKRLELARTSRGFKTPKEASKFFGWVYESYIQHEQGLRGISRQSKKYADAFRVSEAWLLTGEGEGPDGLVKRSVPVVGYVGAGAEIFSIDDHEKGAGMDEVEVPIDGLGPSTVAVIVRGDSMLPVYRPGDLIFYDQTENGDFVHLVGKDCVVRLSDGRTFLKELQRTNGEYWLHSYNSTPVMKVDIEWAAKVKVIKRA